MDFTRQDLQRTMSINVAQPSAAPLMDTVGRSILGPLDEVVMEQHMQPPRGIGLDIDYFPDTH